MVVDVEEPTKVCFKCLKEKPLFEFYAHPSAADGHFNKCKVCARLDVKRNYQDGREARRAYERKREASPRRKKLKAEYARRHRARYPEAYAAQCAVYKAVKSGRLARQPCEGCGTTIRVEAHHHDYSKPLEVEWLCFKCHRERGHGQHVGP